MPVSSLNIYFWLQGSLHQCQYTRLTPKRHYVCKAPHNLRLPSYTIRDTCSKSLHAEQNIVRFTLNSALYQPEIPPQHVQQVEFDVQQTVHEDRLQQLPGNMLYQIMQSIDMDPDFNDLNKTYLALRNSCKQLESVCDLHRKSIAMHTNCVHLACPYISKLTSLTSVTIYALPSSNICKYDMLVLNAAAPHLSSLTLNAPRGTRMDVLNFSTAPRLEMQSLRHLSMSGCIVMYSSAYGRGKPMLSWEPSLPSLTSLTMIQGTMFSLHLLGCQRLNKLEVIENKNLCDLSVLRMNGLSSMVCERNHNLRSLDLLGCTQLCTLRCDSNASLMYLTLGWCIALQALTCTSIEKLIYLDLSSCALLKELNLDRASLRVLDVRFCSKLRNLKCSNSPFLTKIMLPQGGNMDNVHISSCKSLSMIVRSEDCTLENFYCSDSDMLVSIDYIALWHCAVCGVWKTHHWYFWLLLNVDVCVSFIPMTTSP